MRNINKIITLVVVLLSSQAFAHIYEGSKGQSRTINGSKAAGCSPATAITQMAFNNVKARIENGGNMFQDRAFGRPSYQIPNGSGLSSIFAGALWMGGTSPNGQLKLAAVTFRASGDDFWPGPLTNDGSATAQEQWCIDYNRFWGASKAESLRHKAFYDVSYNDPASVGDVFPDGYTQAQNITDWLGAAHGPSGADFLIAPFVDYPGQGTPGLYEPELGDYPGYDLAGTVNCREQTRDVPLFGDTTIYWVFNDKGNVHTETGSDPIGMEIRAQAFAFADKTAINNMTFYNYVLINQGSQTLENTYFAQWVDVDLGNPQDDFVGCDVQRGLGYAYNGDDDDDVNGGPSPGYGTTPPAIGIDFFQGPYQDNDGLDNPGPFDTTLAPVGIKGITYDQAKLGKGIPYAGLGIGYGDTIVDNERFGMRKFLYYNIGTGPINDPQNGQDYYNYLQGIWKDGSRFIYGGNAHTSTLAFAYPKGPVSATAFCDFMFPGDSDPVGWGTEGINYDQNQGKEWTESTAENPPGDRRFMQSSGPFILRPGAVNNITVGIVWARATGGNQLASVEAMRSADDVAQGLFDNCFQIFEGPDAPDLTYRELDKQIVLYLTNPATSNNVGESYRKPRPSTIPSGQDQYYNFEGYIVYQLKNSDVSVSDLDNIDQARIVYQGDIKNFELDVNGNEIQDAPIGKLVNYVFDGSVNTVKPVLQVDGANQGIVHSIKITDDLFATSSDKRLVNNKKYYFVAIAYAYNNYLDYDPVNNAGQAEVFVGSRKNGLGGSITPITVIPHQFYNQNGGTRLNSAFGDQLPVTRLEGIGNGGRNVEITAETEAAILNSPEHYSTSVSYKPGFGPIRVQIVDPMRITDAELQIRVFDDPTKSKPYPNEFSIANYDVSKAKFEVIDATTGDVVATSESSIDLGGEQLLLEYGVSIDLQQFSYSGGSGAEFTLPLTSSIDFKDPAKTWLSGVPDVDTQDLQNWIRSGQVFEGSNFRDNGAHLDPNQYYESILNGTWTAWAYGADTTHGPFPKGTISRASLADTKIAFTPNVDIVLTSDKSKWSRCPVLEMQDKVALAQGGAKKIFLREHASVDKNGRSVGDAGVNVAEATAGGTQPKGMGWFPGYAIDVLTGDRLNIAFGEDSWLRGENGDDMLWNPTSRIRTNIATGSNENTYLFGGKHYIFVFKNLRALWESYNLNNSAKNSMPRYDEGVYMYTKLSSSSAQENSRVFGAGAWIGLPLLQQGFNFKSVEEGLIPTETRIKLRVATRYYHHVSGKIDIGSGGNRLGDKDSPSGNDLNDWLPLYQVKSEGYAPEENVTEIVKNGLSKIRAVPNPYYGYSKDYETNRLDNRIKFTNLPNAVTLSIYTVDGTLINRFTKNNENSIIEWDLKNFANVPISSGTYLIHVEAPGVGEIVLKWFGVMRQVDLQNL